MICHQRSQKVIGDKYFCAAISPDKLLANTLEYVQIILEFTVIRFNLTNDPSKKIEIKSHILIIISSYILINDMVHIKIIVLAEKHNTHPLFLFESNSELEYYEQQDLFGRFTWN